jgi:DNA-binding PadR family transcriptional regulator
VLAVRRLSGYDISRWMDGPGRYIGYGVRSPQIYRKLTTLVERGWIAYEVDSREGRPDAKVYRLTDTGREALLEWARSPYEPSTRPMDPDFKLRFLFAGQLDPAIALEIVDTELAYRLEHDGLDPGFPLPDVYEAQIPEVDPVWAFEVHTMETKARIEQQLGR